MIDNVTMENAWRFDLAAFAQTASEGTWKPFRHLVHAIDIVQNEIIEGNARIIINMPPRYGKSETFSGWLPTWFLDWWPEKRVIASSYEAGIAADWGRKVRDNFIINDMTRTVVRDDVRATNRWHTTAGGGMVTAGVGGALTGRGGDLILVDDPHKNFIEAVSPAKQRQLFSWWQTTLTTRLEPNGSIVLIMTRWCENDLTDWLLKNSDEQWTHIVLRETAEPDDPLERAVGDVLCPERFTPEQVENKKKRMGSTAYAGLCQQRPSPEGGTIFKREWLQYWETLPEKFDEIVQSWDLAFKGSENSDFVCGQVWGKLGADRYLLDQFHARANFTETKTAIIAMAKQYPESRSIFIEDKANGPAIMNDLKRTVPRMIPVNPEGGKIARARSVEPLFESGNVFFPPRSKHPWIDDLIAELLAFPNSANDDRVDAMTQALVKLNNTFQILIGRA